MRKAALPIALVVLTVLMHGCTTAGYLWHLGRGQFDILLRRRPLSESIHSSNVPADERRKLAWVPAMKNFGTRFLGLHGGKSYESFVQLDRPYATLVLSACPADSLEGFKWKFPIVGMVPYKGYFDRQLAEAERDRLKAEGYDVFLRPASAFSTLGWFDDPILSSMLDADEASLANTVIHEMTHATLYFAGHTEFNETVATFVGNQGALAYLGALYGTHSTAVTAAVHDLEDQQRFAAFIRETVAGLRLVFAGPGTRDDRLKAKAAYLAQAKEKFRAMVGPQFHDPAYARFGNAEWNNASLLARDAYYGDLDLFAKLFEIRRGTLREFVTYLRTWENEADPRTRLARESAGGKLEIKLPVGLPSALLPGPGSSDNR